MINTFNTDHLNALQATLNSSGVSKEVIVKLSNRFSKAAVIGAPDKPGAIMITLLNDPRGDGLDVWWVTVFPGSTPKDVADGKVGFENSYSKEFKYWAKMIKMVITTIETGFPKEATL